MKKIEAVIRKSRYSKVKKSLLAIGVSFYTYWDVTGIGNEEKGHVYRGVEYSTSDIQRRYISIVVSDDFVDKTIEVILEEAYTGEIGDGKIFVSAVEEAYRIRTKEKGSSALN